MNTRTKLAIARVLSLITRGVRTMSGKKNTDVACRRSGLWWSLDLAEGIDLSIFLFGAFEHRTARAIRTRLSSGAFVLDLGANIGAHTLAMAGQVGPAGRVIAVEPTDWAFQKLTRNLSLNPGLAVSVVPLQVFLTDTLRESPGFLHSSWNLDDSSGHPVHGGKLQGLKQARVMTVDEMMVEVGPPRLDLIKLDVDGFEARILRGASETMKRFRPPVILELTPYALEEQGDSLEGLLELFSGLGYRLFSENGRKSLPMRAEQLRAILPPGGGINALALFSL